MKTALLYLIVAITFLGCRKQEFSSPDELNKFIADPEHDLKQTNELNGYKVTVTFRPTDLLVYQEIGDQHPTAAAIDSARKKYNSYYYFILSLSHGNREALNPADGLTQYSELVQTLSFRMNDYVTMTTSQSDTIPVGDFMLNRTYGISSTTDILFVFNKEKAKGNEWVQFNLNELGIGLGNQRFRFKVEDLEQPLTLQF
jgi:hypothetical protein